MRQKLCVTILLILLLSLNIQILSAQNTNQHPSIAPYNLEYLEEIRTIELPNAGWATDWSADGTFIATGGYGINIYTADTFELLLTFAEDADIRAIAWSSDNSQLISTSSDGTIHGWNAETGTELFKIETDTTTIDLIALSPENSKLVSSHDFYTLRVWDTLTSELLFELEPADNSVTGIYWSPDGSELFATDQDGKLYFWDASSGSLLEKYERASDITAIDRGSLRLVRRQNNTHVLNKETEDLILVVRHEDISGLSLSPDGSKYISKENSQIFVHDADTQAILYEFNTSRTTRYFVWSPDSSQLIASGDGTVRIWDVTTGEQLHVIEGYFILPLLNELSPDNTSFAFGASDNTVRVRDLNTGEQSLVLSGHTDEITSLNWSPSGEFIASGSVDGTVRVWNTTIGELVQVIDPMGRVSVVAWSPDGDLLATSVTDLTDLTYPYRIRIWDTTTWEQRYQLFRNDGTVENMAWTPDSSRVVSTSSPRESEGYVWNIRTQTRLRRFRHDRHTTQMALSPDGRTVAIGSGDDTIYLWDVDSGAPIIQLEGAIYPTNVTWSPQGTWVAAATGNSFFIWDIKSFEIIDTISSSSIAWSSDEQLLAYISGTNIFFRDIVNAQDLFILQNVVSQQVIFADNNTKLLIIDTESIQILSINDNGVDSDSDGFTDGYDRCPLLAGNFNGCPDNDEDGVLNTVDACPEDPGIVEMLGCPLPGTTSTFANLREGPGTNFPVVRSLSLGTEVEVIGRNAVGDWLLIRSDDIEAWIAVFLIEANLDTDRVPVIDL